MGFRLGRWLFCRCLFFFLFFSDNHIAFFPLLSVPKYKVLGTQCFQILRQGSTTPRLEASISGINLGSGYVKIDTRVKRAFDFPKWWLQQVQVNISLFFFFFFPGGQSRRSCRKERNQIRGIACKTQELLCVFDGLRSFQSITKVSFARLSMPWLKMGWIATLGHDNTMSLLMERWLY